MIAILTSLLLTLPPPATDVELELALQSLQRHKSVTAQLHQLKTSRLFTRPQKASGRIFLVPPRQLRWEYSTPYKAVLVLDGDKASLSYPDIGKQRFDLARNPELKSILDTILFLLRTDPAAMKTRYELTADRSSDELHLTLVPRDKSLRRLIARVEAQINSARGVLSSLRLVEPDGDETLLRFRHIEPDKTIDPKLLVP